MARTSIFKVCHVYVRVFREVRPFWPALALILALGLVWIPISFILPFPLKLVIDNVLGHQPPTGLAARLIPATLAGDSEHLLIVAIIFSVAIALLGIAYKLADWLLREWVADRMVHRFRGELLLHGLRLSPAHHAVRGVHDLGYRINQDAPALQWTAIYGVIPVIVSLSTIACTLYVTATLSPSLAAVALATAVPMIALVHGCQGRLKAKWHLAKEQDSATQSVVHEVLGALRIVTIFGQERRETARFLHHSGLGVAARLRAIRAEGLLGGLLSVGTGAGTAAVLYLGARAVEAHVLSVGDLLMVITYIGQLYAPLQAIGTHVAGQQHAIASMERALDLLDRPVEIRDRPNARPLGRARGDVAFHRVTFGYEGRGPVLEDVSFRVPAGTSVGIVGRTGAGKTTLINLLLRLFDPDQGGVRLDDVDLRDWRLADLRRQFAVVPQDPTLFSTTIAENIAYARPCAAHSEIVAAAKLANIHDFIAGLPQGYDTPVGERGLRLSGGERQRIALACAFLTDAPILILDEPTSAIDQNTEAAIIESLERLRRGRTVFVVAHRLATLRHVDIRLRVEDGNVLVEQESGTVPLRKVS